MIGFLEKLERISYSADKLWKAIEEHYRYDFNKPDKVVSIPMNVAEGIIGTLQGSEIHQNNAFKLARALYQLRQLKLGEQIKRDIEIFKCVSAAYAATKEMREPFNINSSKGNNVRLPEKLQDGVHHYEPFKSFDGNSSLHLSLSEFVLEMANFMGDPTRYITPHEMRNFIVDISKSLLDDNFKCNTDMLKKALSGLDNNDALVLGERETLSYWLEVKRLISHHLKPLSWEKRSGFGMCPVLRSEEERVEVLKSLLKHFTTNERKMFEQAIVIHPEHLTTLPYFYNLQRERSAPVAIQDQDLKIEAPKLNFVFCGFGKK